MNEFEKSPRVFVWRREETDWSDGEPDFFMARSSDLTPGKKQCKYCGERMHHFTKEDSHKYRSSGCLCLICGWAYESEFYEDEAISTWRDTEAIIKDFDINSDHLDVVEVANYLRSSYSDVHSISPRKFEELVSATFSQYGYETSLTKQSRDGGYDVLLLKGQLGPIIVEVKRYRGKVGVDIVRKLRGVQLTQGVSKAKLVTSGYYTKPAIEEAGSDVPLNYGFELELIDADELLSMLDVFREKEFKLVNFDNIRRPR